MQWLAGRPLTCNEGVTGSSPVEGSILFKAFRASTYPENRPLFVSLTYTVHFPVLTEGHGGMDSCPPLRSLPAVGRPTLTRAAEDVGFTQVTWYAGEDIGFHQLVMRAIQASKETGGR